MPIPSASVIANSPHLANSGSTLQNLLGIASGQLGAAFETATLDAEVLLCHCLNKNRSFLRAWPEYQPSAEQTAQFQCLVEQRAQGTPIAYLTGEREFWSRQFKVAPEVLIPRPDTELLIELSLARLPIGRPGRIIDLGTGSGIIAITLAAERPILQVTATDISAPALAIAQHNATQLNTHNVSFLLSNWFEGVGASRFELVISNPPYIAAHDPHLRQGDLRFEPQGALISAENGLHDIQVLAEQARSHLADGGHLLIEHGYNQQSAVQAIFANLHYQDVTTHLDLSGNPRVTSGIWNTP